MDSTGHSLSSVERYNLSNGRVSIEASMISPRSGVGVAVLDGKLYAVGKLQYQPFQYYSSVDTLSIVEFVWKPV